MNERAPLRIKRIEVRDLRAIDQLVIELPTGTEDEASALVIAAANGRGKTSVLEGVLLAVSREDLLPSDRAPYGEWVRQGANEFRVDVETQSARRRIRRTVTGFAGRESLRRNVQMRDGDGMGIPVPGGNEEPVSIEHFSARREPESLGDAASAAGRPSLREERRLHELKRRIVNLIGRKNRTEIFEKISQFYRAFEGDSWGLDVVFASEEPGADAIPVMCCGGVPNGPGGEPLTWDRIVKGEGAPSTIVPLDRLSSGQMALLSLAYPFVFGPPLDIALMDEPEQHLHPTFQRALLPALRELSPRTQFIVATHSPYVLDSVPSYERVLLATDRREPGHEAAQ